MIVTHSNNVDLLILGAGWTSTFLIPLLKRKSISFAATTTTGHSNTIAFKFDPDSTDPAPYTKLPTAQTILITFPLKGKGQSSLLTDLYKSTHSAPSSPSPSPSSSSDPPAFRFIQLGATSLWNNAGWSDENTPIDTGTPRGTAEDELIAYASGCVLDLAGLYGGSRQPGNWVDRIISTKSDLEKKGAVHLIHGNDVARAIVAVHEKFTPGKRWLLTDLHFYDWWDLVQDWSSRALKEAEEGTLTDEGVIGKSRERLKWVGELMVENGVRALPRDSAMVGRVLDARGFWKEMDVYPLEGRVR